MSTLTSTQAASGPVVDRLALTGAAAREGQTVTASVSCELMKNQLPGTAIEATRDTDVVQDAAGAPMILTIGSDQHLLLLATTPGETATGFAEIDLTAGFAGYQGVADFDVTQDRQGRITLAFGLTRQGEAGTDVFVASMLSNDPASNAWTALHDHAVKIGGIDPAFVMRQIRMGTTDDGAPAFSIAVGDLGGQQEYYQFADVAHPAVRYELPENVRTAATTVMQLSIGYVAGERGVWFLYTNGATQTLECTTVPDGSVGPVTIDYSPGQGTVPAAQHYNCIATPVSPGSKGISLASDVYVGTSTGISLFPGAHASKYMEVTDQLTDVHQLDVEQHGSDISIWALCSPNRLYYIYGNKGPSGYVFNPPILFNPSAIHVAPIRSATRNANELFVVSQDLSVTHHWQDPGSTLWQQRTIAVPKTDVILDMETFTTRIALEDARGAALGGVQLELTASEWQYVTANGLVYSLDLDTPATIATDELGSVTLIAHTIDIAPPILHIRADAFTETLNVYPNGRIQQGLAGVKSGADLKSARTASGDLVLPSGTDDNTADGVAQSIGTLTTTGAQDAPGLGGSDHVYVTVTDSAKHTGVLNTNALPTGLAIGMQLRGGMWQPHANPQALLSTGDVLDTIGEWAGDALHWIENAFEDGVKFVSQGIVYLKEGAQFVLKVIDEGLELILTVADKVLRIALKTLGAVFKALNWLLKLVGIDLTAILKWLGHLLGWDAIWDTHKVIAAMMRNGLDYGVAEITNYLEKGRAAVRDAMESLKEDIASLVLPDAAVVASVHPDPGSMHAVHTAPANYSTYHIRHGNLLSGPPPPVAPTGDPAADVWSTIETAVGVVISDLETDVNDLAGMALDPGDALDSVGKFATHLADTVIDPIEVIADGTITVLEDCLTTFRDGLQEPADIPILSTLYEFITDLLGDQEDLTFINAVALMVAIPVVEMSRIAGQGPPFDGGTYGLDSPGLFAAIVGHAAGPAPHAAGLRALAAAAPAAGDGDGTAAADGDSVSETAKKYAEVGAVIAAVAGLIKSVVDILVSATEIQNKSERQPLQQPDPQTMFKAADIPGRVSIAFAVLRQAVTFPVRDPKASSAGYGSLVTAWSIGFTDFVTPFIGKPNVSGGINAAASGVSMVLCLVADGIDTASWWGWFTDISSGLVSVGLGVCEAAEQPEIGILFYAGMFGVCGFTIARVIAADEKMILHAINIA